MQECETNRPEIGTIGLPIDSRVIRHPALAFALLAFQATFEQGAHATDSAQEAASSGSEIAVVSGNISVPASGRRPQMVVYLTPVNDQQELPPPADTVVVSQKGAKFSPSLVVISVGQGVEFRNDEGRPIEHNVFSRSPVKQFDLGLFPPGEERQVVFDSPGVVRLYCSIHRYMDGVIYVCPTPLFAVVDDAGRYRIENVREGEYDMHIWQRRQRYSDQTKRIKVNAGSPQTTNLELNRR